jgi:transcriptional regulator
MYNPAHFREDRVEVLHELIRLHSLATFVTLGPDGLTANHIPMLIEPQPGRFGKLRFHVAKANPVWRNFSANVPALAVFSGPEAYISPSWYAEKQDSGKVVPTWNYATVHAHGTVEVFHDQDRLRAIVADLTQSNEAPFQHPWSIDDAPAEYIDSLLSGIVGLEMTITRLEGKWKVSQNRPKPDRLGVIDALERLGKIASANQVRERMDGR